MTRDLRKDIAEYHRRFDGTNTGNLYTSDFYQIMEIGGSAVDMVFNAIEAGFMIGYRAGKRHSRKKKARA